jgi:hypothetical protein
MRQGIRIFGSIVLAAALSSPAWAGNGHGKGKSGGSGGGGDEAESQAGGLPALEDRVEADEALIATLQAEVGTLNTEVAALTTAVNELETDVTDLETAVADLQGQNNWAVVNANGTIARASSVSVVAGDPHVPGSGVYEVNFGKDVSKCEYQATIGSATAVPLPPPANFITVSGDTDGDSPNDVFVRIFSGPSGGVAPADSSFHLAVTCP